MSSLYNIRTVAAYERKTLFRSWFFRIFAVLTLLILFGMNMGIFAEPGARWTPRSIPANIPYLNVLFVNVAQAVIAVFLASDFLRRDKKLDTTEVIYARPISNGEYVVGKTLGIMVLFTGLVVVVLLMALVFNVLLKDTPVSWWVYLFYPLLITIPTLTFILGLSFFLMILFRSQAVTFLVLLGYIGLTLFYFRDKLNGIMDYMGFYFPMVYSDFIGFAEAEQILMQRAIYFLLGIGFIFATIMFLGRLPQTGKRNYINLAGFLVFLAAGIAMGYQFWEGFSGAEVQRSAYLSLNNQHADDPVPDIISNDIRVKQNGNSLRVSSEIRVKNGNEIPLDSLIFSLNPGYQLDSITRSGETVNYSRKRQLVLVLPDEPLQPDMRMKLAFHYHGTPDPAVAYLDIPKNRRAQLKRILVASVNKMPGITDPDYILLTRELLWYPVAGVGFNTTTFQAAVPDFVRFRLTVEPEAGLTAVAPGRMEREAGTFKFIPENNLNTLPLVIGRLTRISHVVDSVEYNLYIKEGHDYFSGLFSTLQDTLDALIREEKEAYEYDELDLYYAFQRINLVETPVQYHPFERSHTEYVEMVQPEMIFMPERGAGVSTLDFKRIKRGEEQRNERQNRNRTEESIEADVFRYFVRNTFFNATNRAGSDFRGRGEDLLLYDDKDKYRQNPYCAFPLYYNLVSGISSREFPGFNTIIETYLKEGFEVSPRESFRGGLTETERANMVLGRKGLTEIFGENSSSIIRSSIVQLGSFIVNALHNRVGHSEFDSFLYYYIEDHQFTEIDFRQFARDFEAYFGFDPTVYAEFINSETSLPEFLMSSPEYYMTRDEYGDVYVVRMKISNVGGGRGLVDLSFRMPGQGGFGRGGVSEEQRIFEIAAGETKDIQLVFYDQPRLMTVNTTISGNIPATFSVFLRSAIERRITDLEEYTRVSDEPVQIYTEGEIVVDNEDPGFSHVSISNESKLKQYIDARKEPTDRINYKSINPWRAPATWTPVAHSAMFGKIIKSAFLVQSGDGSSKAQWSASLNEAGFYELYVHIPVSAMFGRSQGRSGDNNRRGGRGDSRRGRGPEFADKGTVYHFQVSSSDGLEEIPFALDDVEEGWNKIGTFHFPADTARVTLSNKTNGSRVFADAVKWVPGSQTN